MFLFMYASPQLSLNMSVCFVPGHTKPFDFMDNKAERRVIDTRAANCC